jgi:hypothetical protein
VAEVTPAGSSWHQRSMRTKIGLRYPGPALVDPLLSGLAIPLWWTPVRPQIMTTSSGSKRPQRVDRRLGHWPVSPLPQLRVPNAAHRTLPQLRPAGSNLNEWSSQGLPHAQRPSAGRLVRRWSWGPVTPSAPADPGGGRGMSGLHDLDPLFDALFHGVHVGRGILAGFVQLCPCP